MPTYIRRHDSVTGISRRVRVRQVQPPRPQRKPMTIPSLREICTIWNFDDYKHQAPEIIDRIESLLFDITHGLWASVAERKEALGSAIMQALAEYVETLGFTGFGTSVEIECHYTAFFDRERDVPELPEWLPQGLVGIEEDWTFTRETETR
jgi:hypothetical protein